MKVILASNSPRRKELFFRICPSFSVVAAGVDESVSKALSPCDTVKTLAERKAKYVLESQLNSGMGTDNAEIIVLGSDTVVAYENKILGKPADEIEAFEMLSMLSDKTHYVYTGVCFATVKGVYTQADVTEVTFYPLSAEKIRNYIATGSPMDKAGAYGIQDGGLVKSYKGSYTNVIGLPLELTEKMYKEVVKNVKNSY